MLWCLQPRNAWKSRDWILWECTQKIKRTSEVGRNGVKIHVLLYFTVFFYFHSQHFNTNICRKQVPSFTINAFWGESLISYNTNPADSSSKLNRFWIILTTWGSCRNVCARETFNLFYEYFSEPVLSYLSSEVESVLPLLPESVFTQVSVFFHLCWTSSLICWTCRTQVTKWRTTNRSSRERDILTFTLWDGCSYRFAGSYTSVNAILPFL